MNMNILYATHLMLLFSFSVVCGKSLRIGAFNVQTFGRKKMSNVNVINILIQVAQRYEILLIQEIRDKTQTSFPKLVKRLNDISQHQYNFVQSQRLGRTKSKEQYGYIYKSDHVEVVETYQYPDVEDVFEREPFIVAFKRIKKGHLKTFSFLSLHTKPRNSVSEIDALVDVYNNVSVVLGENILLGGDFNADCRYVCSSCWNRIRLCSDNRFQWLIDSSVDTTVHTTDCAYDRLIVTGSNLRANARDGDVFRFDLAYNLSYKEALRVSDHYPVEFILD